MKSHISYPLRTYILLATGDDTDHRITQGARFAQSRRGRSQSHVDRLGVSAASKNDHTVRRGRHDGAESEDSEIFQSKFLQ